MTITFSFQKNATLKNRLKLKKYLSFFEKKESVSFDELSFIFCSDEYLLEINKSFLSHNYFTDIITFDLSDKTTNLISGEIYISVDTVKKNALDYNTTFENELHRVIFHGILHLCGYKDKKKSDQLTMKQKEEYYLSHYFDNNK
jgi:rRNA maturation RNase YbeY